MKLHLACGGNYLPGYINVDISGKARKDAYCDLFKFPFPWSDNMFEEIVVNHFVEHIPHRIPGQEKDGLVRFMEECWRVLEPGGIMKISHPHPMSQWHWNDPTHCRNVHSGTWYYFNKEWREQCVGGLYEWDCDFDVVDTSYRLSCPETETDETKQYLLNYVPNSVMEVLATLKARKPEHAD